MIESLICSGGSRLSVAALDVAVRIGLSYSGWCRDDDPLPEKYRLERIPGASHRAITEKSLVASDGSLYFLHTNHPSIPLETLKKTALRLNKPLLLIALDHENGFSASQRIAEWIGGNRIRVLHVAGEDEADSPSFGNRVARILEATLFLSMMETGITSPLQSVIKQERSIAKVNAPETMKAALNHLERSLSLKDRAAIANMTADELATLHFTLGAYIDNHFELFSTNTALLEDCRNRSGFREMAPADAAAVIIRALWERLRDGYRIRIVK